ncbi:S-protein homolog 2-like [Punica granatum]|uniref:S-protein homolog 2-like n=2 Tax=Punica granatum TaxID=22663 RepID=A0A6P8D6Y2_PUNGR|nr:S-protein homolog 2-like [Punica granatum]PKI35806.1 hypothetical protein CRG98_043841 [Punica granatum]
MNLLNVKSSLLVLVLSLAVLQETSAKLTVEIFNKLPNGMPLTIHCKSKDDDLGTHVLAVGQSFSFKFRVNIFGSTLFFCGASWQGGQLVFDIYDADRDNNVRCNERCEWEATKDGIEGFMEDDPDPDLHFPWNH